jgi:hypothetical protein
MSDPVSKSMSAQETIVPQDAASPLPKAFPARAENGPGATLPAFAPVVRKNGAKNGTGRDHNIKKDAVYIVRLNDAYHVVSENYSYKTESYYTILKNELDGRQVRPQSSAVIDAYVVPICLERAKLAGIPVCEWGISQAYVPLPAIIYGLNYFSTTSEFFIVDNHDNAKEAIRHITNNGKYPFCYQKLPAGAALHSAVAIFGKTTSTDPETAELAEKTYALFGIPLVRMIMIKNLQDYALSSLAPVRYSQLRDDERSLLCAYLSGQEFL